MAEVGGNGEAATSSSSVGAHSSQENVEIVAMYCLVRLADPHQLKETLCELCQRHNILGALTLAPEGINGTVASSHGDVAAFLQAVKELHVFDEDKLEIKYSHAEKNPFVRMRFLLRPEIVTMGCPDIEPGAGTYVLPKDWNAVISDPEVVVIDTRNDYEVELGTFANAINPNTASFKQFPGYVGEHLDPTKHKKVAMFCTGGIRCEKASSYMLSKGFEKVYHLKGGILQYLEEVPEAESMWTGDCYVFDQRVAVKHGLAHAGYTQCRSCRHPLNIAKGETDPATGSFEDGVCCKYCVDTITVGKKASARERNLQMDLARKQHRAHLGTRVEEENI
jgi:UPF0176 protein